MVMEDNMHMALFPIDDITKKEKKGQNISGQSKRLGGLHSRTVLKRKQTVMV